MAIAVREERCGCCRGLFSLPAECAVITLTLLHVLMSTVELLIHFEVVTVPEAVSTDQLTTTTTSSPVVNTSIYDPGGTRDTEESCDIDPAHPDLKVVILVVQYSTLILSALFLIEIISKIVHLRRQYVKDVRLMFDLLVVVCSLGVEIAFFVLHKTVVCVHPALEIVSFVIILRLWRIPYACNIKKREYKRRLDDEIRYLRQTKFEVDDRCKQLEEARLQQEKQLDKLRSHLQTGHGGVYIGEDRTDGKTTPHINGGLNSSVVTFSNGLEIKKANDNKDSFKPAAAVITDTDNVVHKPDLARKDSDVNSKANDSGIDAKDSFRSDIENTIREGKENDVFIDSDASDTPVPARKNLQQVEVQIEERSRQAQLPSMSQDGDAESPVIMRRKPSDHFVPCFDNAAYDGDGDDVVDDLNASRTYRSADGTPMTEL